MTNAALVPTSDPLAVETFFGFGDGQEPNRSCSKGIDCNRADLDPERFALIPGAAEGATLASVFLGPGRLARCRDAEKFQILADCGRLLLAEDG
jgi:hypothetical protein